MQFRARPQLHPIGDNYKYGGWEVNTITGNAQAAVSKNYIGAEAFASSASGEAYLKLPIPFTESNFVITGSGHLIAIGGEASLDIKNKELTLKLAVGIGAGVSLKIE